MEELFKQFIARYDGRISSYKHIIDLLQNPAFDNQMIEDICHSLVHEFTKQKTEDAAKLKKLEASK